MIARGPWRDAPRIQQGQKPTIRRQSLHRLDRVSLLRANHKRFTGETGPSRMAVHSLNRDSRLAQQPVVVLGSVLVVGVIAPVQANAEAITVVAKKTDLAIPAPPIIPGNEGERDMIAVLPGRTK